MAKTIAQTKVGGISDAAVLAATGKTWKQWTAVLDKAGARKLNHRQIVGIVGGVHGVGSWWQQMVTVSYEQATGLRQKHEKADGFQISRSKTIAAPLRDAFRAFADTKLRAQWLPGDKAQIRKATPGKVIRAGWEGSATSIEVYFLRKGAGKTQVTIQHSKLRGAAHAAKMKTYWGKNLDRLKGILEG